MDDHGIPWLTDPQRELLAHLLVLCIQQQLKPHRSYERVCEALDEIADLGNITMRADDANVWVLVCGRSIVHAERDWLEYTAERWAPARSN